MVRSVAWIRKFAIKVTARIQSHKNTHLPTAVGPRYPDTKLSTKFSTVALLTHTNIPTERYATIITYFPEKLRIPKKVRTSKIPKMVLTLFSLLEILMVIVKCYSVTF